MPSTWLQHDALDTSWGVRGACSDCDWRGDWHDVNSGHTDAMTTARTDTTTHECEPKGALTCG